MAWEERFVLCVYFILCMHIEFDEREKNDFVLELDLVRFGV